jgi:ABC-2 type transport system ATP-binding protein
MAASTPPRLTVRNLTKRYGAIEAVRNVTFEVGAGEIFGLIGPNGAGKTSIIESLLGLRTVDTGTLLLDDLDIQQHSVSARAQMGAQLQFAALQDKITPRQALQVFGAFYSDHIPSGELLQQFSLEDKADVSFDSLSGGQKQRLFLALALINRPRLLVLDEPTAGLDPQARRKLHHLIKSLKQEGRSVLLCTHYLDEAHELCDRIGILHEGKIVAQGTPDELIARLGSLPRIGFRTRFQLDPATVSAVPSVSSQACNDGRWTVSTSHLNQTIAGLIAALDHSGNEMLDLQILRPSLEDVFLELTRTAWVATP